MFIHKECKHSLDKSRFSAEAIAVMLCIEENDISNILALGLKKPTGMQWYGVACSGMWRHVSKD